MTIVSSLDFAEKGLRVSYRASAEPQRLAIHATLKEAEPKGSRLPRRIANLSHVMHAGIASGSEFDPGTSSATILSGLRNKTDAGAAGPEFAWEL